LAREDFLAVCITPAKKERQLGDSRGFRRNAMPCYVGLDASKKFTSICVIGPTGDVLKEGRVESTAREIIEFLRGDGFRYARIGIEAWGLATWLYVGLAKAGLPIICIEARHAHGVLKAQANKTDRSDARGIADLMRTRTYRAVHIKSQASQQTRALLTTRKLLKTKAQDLRNAVRGLLLEYGLKLDRGGTATFERRARTLVARQSFLSSVVEPLLDLTAHILGQVEALELRLEEIAQNDPVCQLLKTAPMVGTLTALHFRTAIDEPGRFPCSRAVGPHLGLVPRTYQSGVSERRGRITKHGDVDARGALFLAARGYFRSDIRSSWLKTWAEEVAARRGSKRALVALARRLAVVLHRMWVTGTAFRYEALGSEPPSGVESESVAVRPDAKGVPPITARFAENVGPIRRRTRGECSSAQKPTDGGAPMSAMGRKQTLAPSHQAGPRARDRLSGS
jgi:transposase